MLILIKIQNCRDSAPPLICCHTTPHLGKLTSPTSWPPFPPNITIPLLHCITPLLKKVDHQDQLPHRPPLISLLCESWPQILLTFHLYSSLQSPWTALFTALLYKYYWLIELYEMIFYKLCQHLLTAQYLGRIKYF